MRINRKPALSPSRNGNASGAGSARKSALSQRRRKPLKAGKKTKAWKSERRRLKKRFEVVGITTCELRNSEKVQHECGIDNYLGFAHSKKRRHIVGDELREVALLCFNAHEIIERLSETEMTVIVREIIAARNVRI